MKLAGTLLATLLATLLGIACTAAPAAPAYALESSPSGGLRDLLGGTTLLSDPPVPEKDPFYSAPGDLARYRDGQVIRTRTIPATVLSLPLPTARAWQLLYRTEDRLGRPIATVTTLLVPRAAWKGAGTRPLLSYQVPEDGVAGKCAPSYAYRTNPVKALSNSYPDQGTIAMALSKGWAVSVPDYEGPRSEFLVAGVSAKGVLDGLRASLGFAPAGLDAHTRLGLWGYSGGGFATLVAAQWQPTYAPDLDVVGIAAGAPATDIAASIRALSGGYAGGTIAMGINGFLRAYPGLHLGRFFTAAGREKIAAASGDCIVNASVRFPLMTIGSLSDIPDVLQTPAIARMLAENSPRYIDRVPAAPVFHYHAKNDELAPYPAARATMRKFCRQGVAVQEVAYPIGEHIAMAGVGAPAALGFLSDRFDGSPAVDDCAALAK